MPNYRFDGVDYVPELDQVRLVGQMSRIWELMRDGRWRSLREIADATGSPEASASAQLRNFRKPRFGGHIVDRQRIVGGLYKYRIRIEDQINLTRRM